MCTITTSYHFEIITSNEIMEVFGTVMSRTPEGIVLDIWCPEEPRLNYRITTTKANIPKMMEALLGEDLERILPADSCFSILYLSY